MEKKVKANTYTRGTSFLINNKKVNPPESGWKKPYKDTPHGAAFIELLRRKEIRLSDRPTEIWRKFPALRVVDPDRFRDFKRACVDGFRREQQATNIKPSKKSPKPKSHKSPKSSWSDYSSESSASSLQDIMYSSDESSSGSPPRRQTKGLGKVTRESRDAPVVGEDKDPLGSVKTTLNTRNKASHLPSTVLYTDDAVLVLWNLLSGQHAHVKDIVVRRHPTNKKRILISFRTLNFGTEAHIIELLQEYHDCDNIKTKPLEQIRRNNGGSDENDVGTPPQTMFVIDVDVSVQPLPSGFQMKSLGKEALGYTVKEVGALENCRPIQVFGNLVLIHFLRDSVNKGAVTRVTGDTSPMRNPNRKQPPEQAGPPSNHGPFAQYATGVHGGDTYANLAHGLPPGTQHFPAPVGPGYYHVSTTAPRPPAPRPPAPTGPPPSHAANGAQWTGDYQHSAGAPVYGQGVPGRPNGAPIHVQGVPGGRPPPDSSGPPPGHAANGAPWNGGYQHSTGAPVYGQGVPGGRPPPAPTGPPPGHAANGAQWNGDYQHSAGAPVYGQGVPGRHHPPNGVPPVPEVHSYHSATYGAPYEGAPAGEDEVREQYYGAYEKNTQQNNEDAYYHVPNPNRNHQASGYDEASASQFSAMSHDFSRADINSKYSSIDDDH